ncbi:hypothetical protein PWT90_09191 [Aphanocladium album]|nr:hypothetical protein PWT90_09191 [Aphanocladium album]
MKVCIATILCIVAPLAEGAGKHGRQTPRNVRIRHNESSARSTSSDVPSYNFSMPVDHFTSSDKRTYSNRFFVNDTYYRAGGPVIFLDYGEGGVDPDNLSESLAEATSRSLPMRLAANLSGIVIGWEHRYYGYSRPVELDEETGFPLSGVQGYKYLSVEQALADVAFFANNFNKTELGLNHNVQSTVGLDPYNTPWIFVGGSYPGARAAWMRAKYPEIIYASWASSAPVQFEFDGSPYYDPVMRSMATNCTNGIRSAIKYMDKAFSSGSSEQLNRIKAAVYMTSTEAELDKIQVSNVPVFDTAKELAHSLTFNDGFQSYGPQKTVQIMCDLMQSFNTDQYDKDMGQARSLESQAAAMINNPGDKKATTGGIAAHDGDDGGERAFAALIYGIYHGNKAYDIFQDSIAKSSSSGDISPNVDTASWNWQTISETGIFQGSNPNNITCVSERYNITAVHDIEYFQDYFGSFNQSDLPQKISNKGLLDMGGWDMKVSNVMFTNGELDPWTSFSVASELADGPHRKIGQSIPTCNAAPQDVFGITYPGAVHVEDMAESTHSGATRVNGQSPMEQGLDLFLEAWKAWQPCFNQSRDSVRNGNGPDGNGNGTGANSKENVGPKSAISLTACLSAVVVAAVGMF